LACPTLESACHNLDMFIAIYSMWAQYRPHQLMNWAHMV
jgi:hypothetical protein